jgi:hypothetical protein
MRIPECLAVGGRFTSELHLRRRGRDSREPMPAEADLPDKAPLRVQTFFAEVIEPLLMWNGGPTECVD